MDRADLCLAWSWEGDADFVRLLEEACAGRSLRVIQATPSTLPALLPEIHAGRLSFRSFLDRASEGDDRFAPLLSWAGQHAWCVNPTENARRAWDKAVTHALLEAHVPLPRTVVLPPWSEREDVEVDTAALGPSFTVKPVHGGGGDGVVVVVTDPVEMAAARRACPDESMLVQERVVPHTLEGRPGWFRVIHSAGRVYSCWWDPETHAYVPVTAAQEEHLGLGELRRISMAIAAASGLRLFSTEVALAARGPLVVDAVNDPIDLRLASKSQDGVPDDIVAYVARDVADLVAASRDAEPGAER